MPEPCPSPDLPFLPYGHQCVGEDEVAAVVAALRSDWLTSGPRVEAFERALASRCGASHAVAVSSGTAALHLALRAAGLGPGDRVLTSANTFLASANAAEMVGASADFADIDPATLCVSRATLEAAWREDVKAVVAVDFAGYPCVGEDLAELVHGRGAVLVEDACHALGGSRHGQRVGAIPGADVTTFSFHPVKVMTTAEGGAVVTGRADLAERCRLLRNHGMTRDAAAYDGIGVEEFLGDAPDAASRPSAPWYYEMRELGYNYRISDVQCALGLAQLGRLEGFVRRRQAIVARYDAAFADLAHVTRPVSASLPAGEGGPEDGNRNVRPAWHLYVLQMDFRAIGKPRAQVMHELRALGVGTQVHYLPVHLQPYYRRKYGYAPGKCPAAESYYARTLSLPLFPSMSDADVERVVEAVRKVIAARPADSEPSTP